MRKRKYRNQPVRVGGRYFASKLERDYADELTMMQKAGEISELKFQPTIRLTDAQITYRADFRFVDNDTGETIHADTKGLETDRFRIIKKLWKYYGPTTLWIVRRGRGKQWNIKKVIPKGHK